MGSPVKVFILAGGLGTRIRNLFPDCPKPLIPFYGKPFLQWQIEVLTSQGFTEFIFCIGYLSDQIVNYFGNGSAFGATIQYSVESSPLGTAGALLHASDHFQHTILLLNGDTYLRTDYSSLLRHHQETILRSGAIASIALVHRNDCDRYGSVEIDSDGSVMNFQEKSDHPKPGFVNAGVYLLQPQILDYIATESYPISLERDTFPTLLHTQDRLFGLPIDGSFIDMGTPDGYASLLAELR